MNGTVTRYEAILDAAESRVRKHGFHAMSFRDIAQDTGIKSASVHYHFPQKEDLGVALVERYAARMMDDLEGEGLPQSSVATDIDRLTNIYRQALIKEDALCLCLMLGAESHGLPEKVRTAVSAFFQNLRDWLTTTFKRAFDDETARKKAVSTLARLQGAMTLAWATGEHEMFDVAILD